MIIIKISKKHYYHLHKKILPSDDIVVRKTTVGHIDIIFIKGDICIRTGDEGKSVPASIFSGTYRISSELTPPKLLCIIAFDSTTYILYDYLYSSQVICHEITHALIRYYTLVDKHNVTQEDVFTPLGDTGMNVEEFICQVLSYKAVFADDWVERFNDYLDNCKLDDVIAIFKEELKKYLGN